MSDFTFPAEMLSQHLAIVGRTGSGKTYTAKGFIEGLLRAKRRVCILDPTGVWYGLRSTADGRRAGFPVAVFGGAHADVPISDQSGAALAKILASKNLPAIIDLSEMLIGQRHRFVTDFAEALYRDNRMPLHLVIDEADEFAPQNPLPETKRMLHQIDRIVRRGRTRGFRVALITQRPAVLHKNVLTQANTLIAMRLTAPQDRKAMQAWVEGQADVAQAKAVLDSLARLAQGEGWVWAPELDFLERVHFPKIATFDSSRTPGDDEVIAEPTKLAAVDLTEIKDSFAAVEQEAQTLQQLRAEVTDLRRKLTIAEKRGDGAGVPEAEVQRRVREAVAAVPAGATISKAMLAGIEKIATGLQAVQAEAAGVTVDVVPRARTVTREAPVQRAAAAPAPLNDGLTGPEQRILDAIAWLESIGVTEAEQPAVAFLAGYSYGGGAYNNPRGRLNSKALVEYLPGGLIRLSDAGRQVANKPEAVGTNDDLHQRVLGRLGGPEQRLLRPLLGAYPNRLSNEELARAAGYTPGAGAFNNPRGRLRSLGLIEYPVPGHVAARSLLFPKGV